jgi:DNA-binding NtrC family response regulator
MANNKSIVLLLADAKVRRKLKKDILLPAGYAVLALDSLEAAQEIIQKEKTTLLLLGNDFGEGEALQMGRAILQEHPQARIVLRANEIGHEEVMTALQAGISDIVQAPFEQSKILEAVARAVQYRKRMQTWLKKETGRLLGKKINAFLNWRRSSNMSMMVCSCWMKIAKYLCLIAHLGNPLAWPIKSGPAMR